MGCPAPKVVKNGDGSRLLLNLDLVYEIVHKVVKASKVPVTVKIRKGWDDDHIVAVSAAKKIEEAGASAIIIHGRTREQFYAGKADWNIIKKVKESVHIPVIGNGDILDGESAQKMLEETGVDGIMIGRAALGNPWIFKEIISYFKGETYEGPSVDEIYTTIISQYKSLIAEKGEYTAIREMRKHISWYVKGMKNATMIRNKINTVETYDEVKAVLHQMCQTGRTFLTLLLF
jgi:nifR3 family TIM-barrel protein